MSLISECISEDKKPSHEESEYYSVSDFELEEGSITSKKDPFLSIQYPSLPNFPTAYLCNQDFRDPDKALKYIMKNFNYKTIIKGLWSFPNLSADPLYYNTFVNSSKFNVISTNLYTIAMPIY